MCLFLFKILISFALYPAHCRVGRGNLVLNHSISHFPPKCGSILLTGGTQRRAFASTLERRNRNLNLNKNFMSSSGDRTHNQSIFLSHFVPLRHDWPLNFYSISYIKIFRILVPKVTSTPSTMNGSRGNE